MSVFDNLLTSDICEFPDCGNEAFRHCIAGCGWRCPEHPCIHMPNDADSGNSWLSTDAVVSRMTDKELAGARLRLQLQLQAIDYEMAMRQFHIRRTTPLYPTAKQAAKREQRGLLTQFINSLSSKQVVELVRRIKGEKK